VRFFFLVYVDILFLLSFFDCGMFLGRGGGLTFLGLADYVSLFSSETALFVLVLDILAFVVLFIIGMLLVFSVR